jgi:hypothetical protein
VAVGLGWVSRGWLGIVEGAVGVAREEGPSSPLQILLSTLIHFRKVCFGNRAIVEPVAEGIALRKEGFFFFFADEGSW